MHFRPSAGVLSTNRQASTRGSGGVEQLMAFQRMAQLVIAKAESSGGRTLVEAIGIKRFFEERSFIGGNRSTKIIGSGRQLRRPLGNGLARLCLVMAWPVDRRDMYDFAAAQ